MPMVGLSGGLTVEPTVVSPCNGTYTRQCTSRGNRYAKRFSKPSIAGKNHRQTTIEILPDDILLEIFDFYRLGAMQVARGGPWKWQCCLTHICRRWRRIVSDSPRRLQLRIIFKSRAPMEYILDAWPDLPIVVRYNGSRKSNPTGKALNNITVALRHPDRVCEIDLAVTSSMLGSILEVIQEPFPALEHIRIKSKDTTGSPPVIPGTLLGGFTPRLSTIRFHGIALPSPALRQLLLSASNLVTLELHIPSIGQFSLEDLATGLSTLTRLNSLELHFDSSNPHPTLSTIRPPTTLTRATLPSVTYFAFHGASEYFEGLVARINLPALNRSSITFFNQLTFEVPRFSGCQFLGRVDALRSLDQVVVKLSRDYIQSSFLPIGLRQRITELRFTTARLAAVLNSPDLPLPCSSPLQCTVP
ncbi:hypothetical protein BJV78DRAFT_314688 [Lactifluus subvellereus]|nr:hypothetical protein BJV78DRAFT_314688 [Lactifluus subvellereus]